MGRGITCDIVGEPPRYLKRKNPQVWRSPGIRRGHATRHQVPRHRHASPRRRHPNFARNLGTPTFLRHPKNRGISTIRFQNLKYGQGNYVRHCWGTTPVSQTEEPHNPRAEPANPTPDTTRPRPVSRPRPRCYARRAALGTAPPARRIRRSCPRDPRPRRGQPRGGRRGRGTGSRTRSPGPRCGRSGSTAGRHRAHHTRRA